MQHVRHHSGGEFSLGQKSGGRKTQPVGCGVVSEGGRGPEGSLPQENQGDRELAERKKLFGAKEMAGQGKVGGVVFRKSRKPCLRACGSESSIRSSGMSCP